MIQKTFDEVKKRNWDFYRENYRAGRYSFNDLACIHNLWYEFVTSHTRTVKRYSSRLVKILRKQRGTVVELGCGEGYLAKEVLSKNQRIENWLGFDICSLAIDNNVCDDSRFAPVALTTDFYNLCFSYEVDVFVSSHTLEHLDYSQVSKIIRMASSFTKSFLVEVPLKEEDYFWKGGASAHVLDKGWAWFKKTMSAYGFKIVVDAGQKNRKEKLGLWLNSRLS